MIDGSLYLIKTSFLERVIQSENTNETFWNGKFQVIINDAPFIDIDTFQDMERFKYILKTYNSGAMSHSEKWCRNTLPLNCELQKQISLPWNLLPETIKWGTIFSSTFRNIWFDCPYGSKILDKKLKDLSRSFDGMRTDIGILLDSVFQRNQKIT